ncbi:GNA1162 family protein [Psittacicella gerlachiana]|uniref:Uncharacterized protein n=1 Tax=Psittacicella gerlachiana TaxID=2028574 RepID=A0A3A1Y2T1_9GAMM|nr:GNA1162 family protein [Psittacicella gerlachiana]RIY32533.1 hypothetical protein CKF59_06880 [Psittacicella gerlachiana]
MIKRWVLSWILGISLVSNSLALPAANMFSREEVAQALAEHKDVIYPAMIRALKVDLVKVNSIVVAPILGTQVDDGVALGIQALFAKQLSALGYYVIPPVISNEFFKSQGLYAGADVKSLNVDSLLKNLGVQAVLFVEAQRGMLDNNLILGNRINVDLSGSLVTYGNFSFLDFSLQHAIALTDNILNPNDSLLVTFAKLIVTMINAIRNDDSPNAKLVKVFSANPWLDNYYALPTSSLFALDVGPAGINNVRLFCLQRTNIKEEDLRNEQEGYQFKLSGMLNCGNDSRLSQLVSYHKMSSPSFWGIEEFPLEVQQQVQEYKNYLSRLGVLK